jgi:hypothetical protein
LFVTSNPFRTPEGDEVVSARSFGLKDSRRKPVEVARGKVDDELVEEPEERPRVWEAHRGTSNRFNNRPVRIRNLIRSDGGLQARGEGFVPSSRDPFDQGI